MWPASGNIPADLFELEFTPPHQTRAPDGGVAAPHLYRVMGDTMAEVPLLSSTRYDGSERLTVGETFAPGTQLLFTVDLPADECAGLAPFPAKFTIIAPQPQPASLGTLSVHTQRAPLQAAQDGCGFSAVDTVFADLKLQLSGEAQSLEDALNLQLLLDGRPYTGFSALLEGEPRLSRNHMRVYAACGSDPSQRALIGASMLGVHRAAMRGTLPNGKIIATPEVTFELSCDSVSSVLPDGGLIADGNWEGNPTAATSSNPDGGMLPDGGMGEPLVDDTRDGCSLARSGDGSGSLWLIGFALALYRVSVRRRRAAARVRRV